MVVGCGEARWGAVGGGRTGERCRAMVGAADEVRAAAGIPLELTLVIAARRLGRPPPSPRGGAGRVLSTTLPSGNLRAVGVGLPRHPGGAKPAGPGGIRQPRLLKNMTVPTMRAGVDGFLPVWLPCGRLGGEGGRIRPTAKPSHAATASSPADPISLRVRPAGGRFSR